MVNQKQYFYEHIEDLFDLFFIKLMQNRISIKLIKI